MTSIIEKQQALEPGLPTKVDTEHKLSDEHSSNEKTPEKDAKSEPKAEEAGDEETESKGSFRDFIASRSHPYQISFRLTFQQRIFGYTDGLDRALYIIALGCSIASGAALPLMTIIFGIQT